MIAKFRGQGSDTGHADCRGVLIITLSGPAGCGKTLVFKVLRALLPLLGVDQVVLKTRETN